MEQVDVIRVKRAFVLADECKGIFDDSPDLDILQRRYDEMKRGVGCLFVHEVDRRISDKVRLERYGSMDWHFDPAVPLAGMGSWPKMSEFDIHVTTDNIVKTAKYFNLIREASEKREGFDFSHYENFESPRENIFPDAIARTDSIIRNIDFVKPNFPFILFPGGEIREREYNAWARNECETLCNVFEYDIDQGNARAIAYVLNGDSTAPAFVGSYRD